MKLRMDECANIMNNIDTMDFGDDFINVWAATAAHTFIIFIIYYF